MQVCLGLTVLWASMGSKATVILYENTFDSDSSLHDFTELHESYRGAEFTLPHPLVSVENGELSIRGNQILDRFYLGFDARTLIPGLQPTLDNNRAPISWSFNVSNENGLYNSAFKIFMGATGPYPYASIQERGYSFGGGGYVGDRMIMERFNLGAGGNSTNLVDIPSENGQGPLPDRGTYRITYDPSAGEWYLYGIIADIYLDPLGDLPLMGRASDSVYTGTELPWMGLFGGNDGVVRYDNFRVTTVPLPGSLPLVAMGFVSYALSTRRTTRRKKVAPRET